MNTCQPRVYATLFILLSAGMIILHARTQQLHRSMQQQIEISKKTVDAAERLTQGLESVIAVVLRHDKHHTETNRSVALLSADLTRNLRQQTATKAAESRILDMKSGSRAWPPTALPDP